MKEIGKIPLILALVLILSLSLGLAQSYSPDSQWGWSTTPSYPTTPSYSQINNVRTWSVKGHNASYRVGEPISIYVQTDAPAYIYAFGSTEKGDKYNLFYGNSPTANVRAHETTMINSGNFFTPYAYGQARITVVASNTPLNTDEIYSIRNSFVSIPASMGYMSIPNNQHYESLRWTWDVVDFVVSR